MKTICLVCLCVFALFQGLMAQQIEVKFIILDSLTHEPVAYATIRCPELARTSAANAAGEFAVLLDHANLDFVISSVGYKSKSFSPTGTNVVVYLAPTVTQMKEVIILASKPSSQAKKIVKTTFDQLRKRTGAFATVADLRHTIKQNDTYVKMLDAQVLFQEGKNYTGSVRPEFVQERITYLQKRESLDFATDRVDFQRSYFDFYYNDFAFLLKNGLKYALTSREYDFYIERTDELEKEIRYEISAYDKTAIRPDGYYEIFDITYEIYVDKTTQEHFLKSYELNYRSYLSKKFLKHMENTFFRIQMRKSGKNFMPEYIEHFLLQTTQYDSLSKPSHVEAFHHLSFDAAVQPGKSKPVKNIQYLPEYWKNKPIDSQAQKHLSKYVDLEKQFEWQHLATEKQVNQEQVSKKIIDIYIGDNKQQNTYLVLWDKPESIMDFLNAPDVIDQRKGKLIFIGALASNREWAFIIEGNGTMFYPQFNLPSLIRTYLPTGATMPCYVLIKKSGDKIHKERPFDLGVFE